ncbi:MAG: hypothetical protein AAB348_00475 [Patescibacteria group bacterium]
MDKYFEWDLEKLAQKQGLSEVLKELDLNELERYLLTRLFVPKPDAMKQTLEQYKEAVQHMRGIPENSRPWLTAEDVAKMTIDNEFLSSAEFHDRLLRSLYVWHFDYYRGPVLAMLRKLEMFTSGTYLFPDLMDPYGSAVLRATLLLAVKYFQDLQTALQAYLLNRNFLVLCIGMGLDLDDALRRAVDYFYIIENRREFALDMSTFLYNNETYLGVKPDGSMGDASYWIDQFEIFSNKKFDGVSLINFMADQARWKNTTDEERMVIKQIIELFVHLVSDHYVMPPAEVIAEYERKSGTPAKKEPAKQGVSLNDVKKNIEREFKKDAEGQFVNLEGALAKLADLAEKYGNPDIAEMYYFDEGENKFKWKE